MNMTTKKLTNHWRWSRFR